MFISFRRAKNLKDTLVRAKLRPSGEEQVEKGTFRCNGRKSCQICPIVVEGDTFRNFNESRSFTNFSGAYNVFSVRRKELFWQYKLGTFIPNGLNERAADAELDMFACCIA